MPDKRKPIEKVWKEFAKQTLPQDAKPSQIADMKMAFYAGAHSLFGILMAETDDGEDEPTQSNVDMMGDVQADINAFLVSIMGN